MNHIGYFIDAIGHELVYRCVTCKYDTFQEPNIKQHVTAHPPIVLPETDIPIDEWANWQKTGPLRDSRITIGLLTWNSKEASTLAAKAIVREINFLRAIGIEASACWVDNGSTDGTQDRVRPIISLVQSAAITWNENRGQSAARNKILDYAAQTDADYVMFVDGDICVIPYSSYALMRSMCNSYIGCVGMYSYNCTHVEDDPTIATECRCIPSGSHRTKPSIAWTQYGVFSHRVLNSLRFDMAECFRGEGWGFEDDDFALQMMSIGLTSLNTNMFRYLHTRRNSSLRRMDPTLAAKVYRARKEYLVQKWGNHNLSPEARIYLDGIRNQTMPTLDT